MSPTPTDPYEAYIQELIDQACGFVPDLEAELAALLAWYGEEYGSTSRGTV